jgi:hypothetical protein
VDDVKERRDLLRAINTHIQLADKLLHELR